ncbi:ATP-binding cassette sub- G member 2 [Phlyctochytrium bullatum]|nr:ATP-binding cassette sub- G member 2 [Phlyctochytrium bullatum]
MGLTYLNNVTNLQNLMGVVFFFAAYNVMSAAQSQLAMFLRTKPVLIREYGAGYYAMAPFFLSKVFCQLPLNIVFPWIQATIVYFMAGFERSVDKYFVVVAFTIVLNVSGPMKYGFEGMLRYLVTGNNQADQLLRAIFGSVELSPWKCAAILLGITAALLIAAYINLYAVVNKKSKVKQAGAGPKASAGK